MCAEDYIANRLVDLCEKRGLTKYRLAQLTGMSQTAIGSIISKESIPTIPTLEKLCSAFGITLAQFFSNEGESSKFDRDSKRNPYDMGFVGC